MKTAFISTYGPRECGIATFTENLIHAMSQSLSNDKKEFNPFVIAMDDRKESYDYPKIVHYTVRESHQKDYLRAADYINYNADVYILQHEFGIYGGKDGVYILPLIHKLKVPLIVTFHTILKDPAFGQKAIIQEIGKSAAKIIVMSKMAVNFLVTLYHLPEDKIQVIEHGLPDFDFTKHKFYKQKFHIEDKISLMTFGLLSRGKGIETVIRALPEVVKRYPNIQYTILGKTHPNVLKLSGEEYRNFLKRLVQQNGLSDHVVFIDTFLEEEALCEYLSAIDIYITPYPNEAQITSGTLTYALGAGTAIFSTPYWHAAELLADNRGVLFNFNDPEDLTGKLLEYLGSPEKIKEIRENAFVYGQNITWTQQGKKYFEAAEKAIEYYDREPQKKKKKVIDPTLLPKFNLAHVKRLTDFTGILQHAKYNIPDYHHGYCLDDNARALLVMAMAYQRQKEPEAIEMLPIYLAYVMYSQNTDGTFHNFMSFDRRFLDETGSEDSFGRTVWALGYLLDNAPNDAIFQTTKMIFDKSVQQFEKLQSLRGIANTLIGIYFYLEKFPWDEGMVEIMKLLANKLVKQYENFKTDDWKWFEDILTYDNGILPASLYYTYQKTEVPVFLDVANETTRFLDNVIYEGDHISLIGSNKWYKKGGERSKFDQQPIDAMAMVLLYRKAFNLTGNKVYLEKMFTSFMWFFGENDLRIPLYDYETKGCSDGLHKDRVNRNQGAESMLVYLMAHLFVLIAFENERV